MGFQQDEAMNNIGKVFNILLKEFGPQGWWPVNGKYNGGPKTDSERFEVCIGAILTQGTSWKNVEKAIESLKQNNALNQKAILAMPVSKLAKLIKSSGYHNQKAKKLKEFVKFDGGLTRENLLSVWGIGPETADSILLYAYSKPYFVVDAYTKRIFSRLGLCKDDCKYEELQELFYGNLPKNAKLFNEYHALIVELAKRNCMKNPECKGCALRKICQKRV
jgi:endonuclease-3 related protein